MDQDLLEKFQCFKQKINALRDAQKNEDQKSLFRSLIFNEEERLLTIESSQFEIEKESPIVIQRISEIVQLLEDIEFLGVQWLNINISSFKGELDHSTINALIRSLRGLKNVSVLNVAQETNGDWNLYSLLIFSLFEISDSFNQFSYSTYHAEQTISISSNHNIYEYSIESKSKVSGQIELGRVFQKILELTTMYKQQNQLQSNVNPSSIHKLIGNEKMIYFKSRFLYSIDPLSYVHALSNLMRIWSLDYELIQKVQFPISSYKLVDQVETWGVNIKDLFKQVKILDKTHIIISQTNSNYFDKIIALLQLVKGVHFDETNNDRFFERLLKKSNQEKGAFDNIKYFQITARDMEQIDQFKQIANCFKKLEVCFLAPTVLSLKKLDLLSHFYGVMQIIIRVKKFLFLDLMLFNSEKYQFVVTFNNMKQGFQFALEELLKGIQIMDKPICLLLRNKKGKDSTLDQSEQKDLIEGIKKIIRVSQIVGLELDFGQGLSEIHSIISERNSFFKMVTAFFLLISSEMTYNPHAIIADLFDFSN